MPILTAHSLKPLRRLSMMVACALMGGVVQAQPTPTLAGHDNDTQILPIWNARSGRVEALLLLSSDEDSGNPLDRVFPREPAMPSIGFGVALDGGSQLRGMLQPDMNTGLAILCNQGVHVAMTLGTLGQECLLTQVGIAADPLLSSVRSPGLSLDTQWQSADGGMDLSFGLSWLDASLHSTEPAPFLAGLGGTTTYSPSLPQLLPITLGDISLRQVHLKGSFSLGRQNWWSLGGSVSRQELNLLAGHQQVHWDSAAITLGVGHRKLSGYLTGRLIELPQGRNITGVDLGFSWRTPWQGELSFGAKNVLNQTPDSSTWPLAELPVLEAPGGRTPYVRYKQDL